MSELRKQSVDDIIIERDVMVRMRDGVLLATDIYRPGGKTPVSVVMERTPYDKSRASRSEIVLPDRTAMSRQAVAEYFVNRGYAFMYQDCRGRHNSEGTFSKYLSEGDDGYDTLEWLGTQDWFDGRAATMGLSYGTHTQTTLASTGPKHLAAMLLDSGGASDAFHCGIRQGGAFEMKQVTWAFNHGGAGPEVLADPNLKAYHDSQDLTQWFARMPWKPGHSGVSHLPEYEDGLFLQWTAGNYDEYWQRVGHKAHYDKFPDVPAVVMSSWYDAWVPAVLSHYEHMDKASRSPLSLIMGPWLHGSRYETYAGDIDFGPDSVFEGGFGKSWIEYRANWLDRCWASDAEIPDRHRQVRLFLMGGGSGRQNEAGRMEHGGRWMDFANWPVPGVQPMTLNLHDDGQLSAVQPAAGSAGLSYQHDPKNPVPTIGGSLTSGEPIFSGGGFNQVESPRFFGCKDTGIPLSARPDVLVFETEPLTEDLAVIGQVEIRLWVTSDCPDTDFTAKLIDVYPANVDYPAGYALNIADGIMRCRYRKSWENPEPIAPGEEFEIVIRPFQTANLFKAGHRIRVDIASSSFPHFDVNSNTCEPEGRSRMTRIATNTVFTDAVRRSHIILPVLSTESLKTV
ncbi:CocE/NonD family hydrolase [Rhizobium sp. AU243]|uniref:CocE/NonD family hydrolase n=1 Tax=Rhizobium sp. AU243 TaxID=2303425 RepID=UPI00256FD04A|nr:CocE/NonD family hydrolase [Rhizobium sp. AU243]